MCQYKNNCKTFIPSPRNNSVCLRLCTRNPQLNYEIPDEFTPLRALTPAEQELDENYEISPLKVLKGNDNFDITSIREEVAKIEANKKLTKGKKRDTIQDLLIKRGVVHSTDGEILDTRNLDAPQNKALQEVLSETPKRKKQMADVAKVVEDNTIVSQDVTGWKAPRRKGKGQR